MAFIIIGVLGLSLDCDATQIVMAQAGFLTAKAIVETIRAAISFERGRRLHDAIMDRSISRHPEAP